jgi:NADPH:quinone reductase-like Zn-dependent oxidoreductase
VRALQLFGENDLRPVDIAPPPPPAPDEVQISIRAVGLNHLDVWSYRGMAFARRRLPQISGAEAAGEVVATGDSSSRFHIGQRVVLYGADTCGVCRACREGRDNLCEAVAGVRGFHLDGFACELVNRPERLVIAIPDDIPFAEAACAPVCFGTAHHMLFDNARLESGETVLVHAGGSGIGTAAIKFAKAVGCTVVTTVGSDEKAARARAIGADHVINYGRDRFEGEVRRLTQRKGVDVVFEHVGADTWNGSLLCLKRGGRLVTCGSTSGITTTMNLMQLFQQQYRIFGSFGCRIENIIESLEAMRGGLKPVIDAVYPIEGFVQAVERLRARDVFGKLIVTL